jgi:hypothetical protein
VFAKGVIHAKSKLCSLPRGAAASATRRSLDTEFRVPFLLVRRQGHTLDCVHAQPEWVHSGREPRSQPPPNALTSRMLALIRRIWISATANFAARVAFSVTTTCRYVTSPIWY